MAKDTKTPLGAWLRSAYPCERQDLAALLGTSVNYLYQLAGVHRENPSLRLALALVETANAIRATRLVNDDLAREPERCALPLLTLQDIATPTKH
jgi:hypothetical protein